MIHEVVGTAHYNGHNLELIQEFGRFKDTELYNCEGWYVLDSEGNQVIIDSDWTKDIVKYNPTMSGKDIVRIHTYYENLIIVDKDEIAYFMDPQELIQILKKHKFNIENKRTRAWLTKK